MVNVVALIVIDTESDVTPVAIGGVFSVAKPPPPLIVVSVGHTVGLKLIKQVDGCIV